MAISTRHGEPGDARTAADLWLRARKAAMPAIPAPVHSDEEVRRWFATHVVGGCELWVAEEDGRLAGILVLEGDWIGQLYVDPSLTGRGIGSRLLDVAKRERAGRVLCLWTFQSNLGAQRFYERHGFAEVRRTDGRDNEEGAPDILYASAPEPAGD